MNEEKGGARSQRSAQGPEPNASNQGLESVESRSQAAEFKDVSGPQAKTESDSTKAEDEEVRELLGKFARLNAVRAALMGAGGIVGLATALA